MKKFIALLLASLMILTAVPALAAEQTTGEWAEHEAIVMVSSGYNTAAALKGVSVSEPLDFSAPEGEKHTSSADDFYIFKASSTKYSTQQLIDMYAGQRGVLAVTPNYTLTIDGLTDDEYSDEQWTLYNDGQFAGTPETDLDVSSVWETGTTGTDAVVAVVDTGVDYSHEDLADNMWINPYPRDLAGTYGYDFAENDTDPMDEHGHGTHCAGIIAAQANNGIGVSGVNQNAKIMALRFIGSNGQGSNYDAMQCYNYIYRAMKRGVNVVAINNSWGGPGYSSLFKAVIDRVGELGAISVIAAGNSGVDLNPTPFLDAPAAIDSPYSITVAAATPTGDKATFSNYGDAYVNIAAPGTGILSSVSYDNLLPMLLDEEKRDELAAGYADFEGYNSFGDMRILAPDGATVTAETSSEQFFGAKGASLRIEYSMLAADQPIYIIFPYEAEAGQGKSQVSLDLYKESFSGEHTSELYDSAYFETAEDFDEDESRLIKGSPLTSANHWTTFTTTEEVDTEEGSRCLVLKIYSPDDDGSGSLYIDNPTVSRVTQDTSAFGKYAFYNGTSMATPAVTGALALVAAANPEMTAPELRATIIGSSTQTEGLAGFVATDGYLDLSRLSDPGPCISDIALLSDGTIEISGYNFGSTPTVAIDDNEKAVISASDTLITVSGEGLAEQLSMIEVKNDRGRCKKSKLLTEGERGYEDLGSILDIYKNGELISSGTELYYIDENGRVYLHEDGGFTNIASLEPRVINPEATSNAVCKLSGKPVYLSSRIYAVFCVDDGFYCTFRLARFNIATGKWHDVAALPSEGGMDNAMYSTLAVYNSRLYLIGGVNVATQQPLSTVMRFNAGALSWQRMADMPEGRFYAHANQIGDKLYLTLGGNGLTTAPSILIFDGKEWKEGAKSPVPANTILTLKTDAIPLVYAEAAVGVTDGGLIFSNASVAGFGDTVIYDVLSNSYKAVDARLTMLESYRTLGTATDGIHYAVMTTADEDGKLNYAELYALPIESGMNVLSASISGKGTVTGEGAYLPGDAVRLQATPATGWKLSSFKINGTAKTAPTTIVMNSDVTVEAKFVKTKAIPTSR